MNKINKKPMIKGLQAVRAFAFLFIFTSHLFSGVLNILGAFGVSLFIILSGFVLIYKNFNSTIKSNNFKYSLNKILKLYPLHITTLLITIFLSAFFGIFAPIELSAD